MTRPAWLSPGQPTSAKKWELRMCQGHMSHDACNSKTIPASMCCPESCSWHTVLMLQRSTAAQPLRLHDSRCSTYISDTFSNRLWEVGALMIVLECPNQLDFDPDNWCVSNIVGVSGSEMSSSFAGGSLVYKHALPAGSNRPLRRHIDCTLIAISVHGRKVVSLRLRGGFWIHCLVKLHDRFLQPTIQSKNSRGTSQQEGISTSVYIDCTQRSCKGCTFQFWYFSAHLLLVGFAVAGLLFKPLPFCCGSYICAWGCAFCPWNLEGPAR